MPEFHRVANPRAWWRPFGEFITVQLIFFVSFIALMLPIDALPGDLSEEVGGTIAFLAFVPALALAVKAAGNRPFSQLISAGGRWSDRQQSIALSVAGGVSILALAVGTPLLGPKWTVDSLPMALFFLLMTPVMAFAEELLFRGWFPQFFGSWIRSGLICFLLPVPLFAWIHQPVGTLQWVNHLVPGVCFALLAWRAQSIVASTVLHAASNLTLALLDMFTGYSEGSTSSILMAKLLCLLLATGIILWRLPVKQGPRNEVPFK